MLCLDDDRDPAQRTRTVILAVSPDPKTSCFDSRETQSDGLPQSGGVYVRDSILVAHTTIGEVQALAGDVAVGVGRIVGGEPARRKRVRWR